MRVLIVGLNYLPESTSIGPFTADLAEYLLTQGHEVEVITSFPNAPYWRVWDEYRGKFFQREVINGVPVLRTFLITPKKMRRSYLRIICDLSFTLSALIGGLTNGKCDVVLVISPPLQLGITGWILSRLKRAKLFFHIQDLIPDIAVATGMLSEDSRTVKIAHALESFIYKRSLKIGVICEGFAQNLQIKGVPEKKIKLIHNSIDLNFIRPVDHNNSFRDKHSISPDKFVVMYSGSISLKQGLPTLLDTAVLLQNYSEIGFYIIGEGPYLADLKKQAAGLGLRNVTFLPLQPREGLCEQLGAADLLVITQKKAVTDMVFPGKLLYYTAAGRPILAAVSTNSETGQFISNNKVGVVVPPEEPQAMADTILELYREGVAIMGQNGRRIAEEYFDRQSILKTFMRELQSLVPDKAASNAVQGPSKEASTLKGNGKTA